MCLATTERGQPEIGQAALQLAQIMTAQAEVSGEIGGTGEETPLPDMRAPLLHALLLGFPDSHVQGLHLTQELRHVCCRVRVFFRIHGIDSL